MQEFTGKFHNLTGVSSGEHKKLFNAFTRDLEQQGHEFAMEFARNLIPKNHQEEIFRVKLFIKYNSSVDLLQILIGGNRILSRIVLKSNFGNIFSNISSTQFIREIFPKVSFVNRTKIINKLSFCIDNDRVGEEYFNAVYNEYGLKISAPLLAVCRADFIRVKITLVKFKFSERHLIRLHKKHPGLIPDYFKELSKYEDNCFANCGHFARYLALNDVPTFWGLLEYGFPKIGKKGCYNIVKIYKSEIIKNTQKYKSFVKPRLVLKTLTSEEFDQIFRNLFPKSVDNIRIYGGIDNCIKILPKMKRLIAFQAAFKDVYGFEFEEKMCEYQLQQYWFTPEDQKFFIGDLESYNIELIKEKIKLANDIKIRTEFLCKLIKTCKIIDDQNVLLEVLKYFAIRHRNEPVEVRCKVLSELLHTFELHKLNQDLWDVILELLNFFENDGDYYYDRGPFLAQYIHYKLIRGFDITETMKDWIRSVGIYGAFSVLGTRYPNYERICLSRIPEFVEEVYPDEKNVVIMQFVCEILNWNKYFPRKTISYYKFPSVVKYFFDAIKADNYAYWITNAILPFIPPDQNEKIIRKGFLDHLFKNYPKTVHPFKTHIILKHDPDIVVKYIDLFFEVAEEEFYYELSKMQYHEVYKLIKEKAEIWIKSDDLKKIKSSIRFYSFQSGFYKLASQYVPFNENINPNEKVTTEIRKFLLKCLKNPSTPEEFIPICITFNSKEYLRYSLEPLYFILFHSREQFIYNTISNLENTSISTRKHAILLATILCPQKVGLEILKNMIQTEKHISTKKYILKRTLKYLSNEGTELSWSFLNPQLKTIDVSHSHVLKIVSKFKIIPRQYISEYVSLIWEKMKDCKANEILKLITINMFPLVPAEIFEEIIQKTVFDENWNEFVLNFLFTDLSTDKSIVFDCVKEAIQENTMITNNDKIKKCYDLYKNICKRIIIEKEDSALLLKNYSNYCNNDLNFILLERATEIYLKYKNLSLAKIIIQLQNEVLGQYGEKLLVIYSDFAFQFLSLVFSTYEIENPFSMIEVIEEMIQHDSSVHACLLSLELLPVNTTLDLEFNRRRALILSEMSKHPSYVINTYISRVLLKLNY